MHGDDERRRRRFAELPRISAPLQHANVVSATLADLLAVSERGMGVRRLSVQHWVPVGAGLVQMNGVHLEEEKGPEEEKDDDEDDLNDADELPELVDASDMPELVSE